MTGMTDGPALRKQVLSGLELVLILLLLLATLGVGLYTHQTLSRVRQDLPAEILAQVHELTLLIQDLTELVHAVDVALLDPQPARRQAVLECNNSLQSRLAALRQSYVFDNMVGASALHALLNPASEDIQRWLTAGVSGLPADSATVMRLVETRTRTALSGARELALAGSSTALGLLNQQSQRLAVFQRGMLVLLLLLTGLSLAVMSLLVNQRRVERRLTLLRGRLAESVESIPEGFILSDADDRVVMCNESYRRMYPMLAHLAQPGTPFSELTRTFIQAELGPADDQKIERAVAARLAHHRQPDGSFELELNDGRWLRISERRTRDGGTVSIHADITDIRKVQERLHHLAHHDPLTGLPNRAYFQERMEQALIRASRTDHRVALLYLDLDRFKQINDTLGHAAGDDVLQVVARRLRQHLREEDTLARIGGDEFMVLLEDVLDPAAVETLVQRLLATLSQPLYRHGQELTVTSSLGIAFYPEAGDDCRSLMQNADAAGYAAKAQGPNRYCIHTPDLNAATRHHRQLEDELRQALERDELRLYYQPRHRLSDGRLSGVEALLRWQHPQRGLLTPVQFLTLAEGSGLSLVISRWTLHQALQQYRLWQNAGLSVGRLAVNLSRRQLQQPDLADTVRALLHEQALPPTCLELEVAESTLMAVGVNASAVLQPLAALGVGLVVDNFGAAQAAFGLLKRLPLTTVKFDREFILKVSARADGPAVLAALLTLALTLKLNVVAEGVENRAQRDLLHACGCPEGQGYYFGEPVPAAELALRLSAACTGSGRA